MESFSADERRVLAPYFTNLDGPVFALVNLPEVVKGALFARYSRSAKSVRRLFLDEFLGQIGTADAVATSTVGTERADRLYARVLSDYGDDSVAQLGNLRERVVLGPCAGNFGVIELTLQRGKEIERVATSISAGDLAFLFPKERRRGRRVIGTLAALLLHVKL